ncbi:MAG: hypothetical protein ACOWWO_16715 [Peptococcaceae bacterium]
MKKSNIRFDPLYRVIDEPELLSSIEGKLRFYFNRIKDINNLGIIPEVFKMAKYPKYEHALGLIHQIESLLSIDNKGIIPDTYKDPLRMAAIFLHLGHMPYTFTTERALLLACNLGNRGEPNLIKRNVEKNINKVLEKIDLSQERKSQILSDLFNLKDYKILYHFFSCLILLDTYNSLGNLISNGDLKIIIEDMIDTEKDGYKYLELADKADYVQRDALYLGTIKIDIVPKHLYTPLLSKSKQLSVNEETLLDYNLRYLSERFYDDPEIVCFSKLLEKILAGLIMSKPFNIKWLQEYNDSEFKKLICNSRNKNDKKIRLPKKWVNRSKKLLSGKINFHEILHLNGTIFDNDIDIIDIEYNLLGKGESLYGLLEYPFNIGIVLSINYENEETAIIKSTSSSYSISIFQDNYNRNLLELIRIIERLILHSSIFNHDSEIKEMIGKQFAYKNSIRFDNSAIINEISLAINDISLSEPFSIINFLSCINGYSKYKSIWNIFDNDYLWRNLFQINKDIFTDNLDIFVKGLLGLPVRLLQYKNPKSFLNKIYNRLLKTISSDIDNSRKGNIFEALWLINCIMNREGEFQYFLNGLIIIDPENHNNQQDINEYDVIEIRRMKNNTIECWIYACSIADDYEGRNKNPIQKFAENIHKEYPNIKIETRYVIPKDKKGNDWSPNLVQTGIGWEAEELIT